MRTLLRHRFLLLCLLLGALASLSLHAEDGYRLWLRYDTLPEPEQRAQLSSALDQISLQAPSLANKATLQAANDELLQGIHGVLGNVPRIHFSECKPDATLGTDGYRISLPSKGSLRIQANTELGLLYGSFALLRSVQTGRTAFSFAQESTPRIQRRILNHWDNLNRTVERGQAGQSLWDWWVLPEVLSPRYRDYARACASIGINGTVLTNVNADALVLTPDYLRKVAALAGVFRPYGVRVYLTARWSAPMEIGGLKTADPLDPAVAAWWETKVDEIYKAIPDFGGFLVKANSEGQPGPQNYGRTHADGANLLARALAPHGGIVMWRAFVYEPRPGVDRLKQAQLEFAPLDGQFLPNVVVQIKNGPLDFMPREPFHPLFGAMPRTPLALEVQITQEYLGGSKQLAFLAPLWKECLDSDTLAYGKNSTVARIIDGSATGRPLSVIAGVANIGSDRNWTGHPLAQANWYAFGRLAWNPELSSAQIAEEWTRMSFDNNPLVIDTVVPLLLGSRETVVRYSMPLGLHHIMAEGHHYGPGPWDEASRPDWSSTYYHKAAADGIGANRTATGTNVLEQYSPEWRQTWGNVESCPENLLLWFHHLPWDHTMKSGRPLWDELCLRYQAGVDEVRAMRRQWQGLAPFIDQERHQHAGALLAIQEQDAVIWRDACLSYFQTFSKRPLPQGVEPATYDWNYHKARRLRLVPGNPSGH